MSEPVVRPVSLADAARDLRSNRDGDVILRFIADCVASRGYPPSIREIADHLGHSSIGTVHKRLRNLRLAGKLQWNDGCPRTLRIVLPEADA